MKNVVKILRYDKYKMTVNRDLNLINFEHFKYYIYLQCLETNIFSTN